MKKLLADHWEKHQHHHFRALKVSTLGSFLLSGAVGFYTQFNPDIPTTAQKAGEQGGLAPLHLAVGAFTSLNQNINNEFNPGDTNGGAVEATLVKGLAAPFEAVGSAYAIIPVGFGMLGGYVGGRLGHASSDKAHILPENPDPAPVRATSTAKPSAGQALKK